MSRLPHDPIEPDPIEPDPTPADADLQAGTPPVSERGASVLAARAWCRGAVPEADRWLAHLREEIPSAALSIAWVMVEEHLEAEDEGQLDEAAVARDFAAAAQWLWHCSRQGDPIARRVCAEVDLESEDLAVSWAWAIVTVARELGRVAGPDGPVRRTCPLGPAVLDLDDLEDIVAVLRAHGEEPVVTSVGRLGGRRIVDDVAFEPRRALRRLYLRSADEEVEVALGRRGSSVCGPAAAVERIERLVAARLRVRSPYRDPGLWARAMHPFGVALFSAVVAGAASAADGTSDPAVVPYYFALLVVLVVCTGYRVLTQPRRDARRRQQDPNPMTAGGPVRISRTRRSDVTRM